MGSSPRRARATAARWVTALSWINLCSLLLVSVLLFAISENWWFSAAMTYLPKFPYLLPALLLLMASILWNRSAVPVNLISAAMVLVPIMGLTLPIGMWIFGSPTTERQLLKIVSCNVQDYQPDFASVLKEIGRINPDVVAFQDATRSSKLMQQYFEKWHFLRRGEFFVASRFPVKLIEVGRFEAFDRNAIVKYEIELPTAKITLFNLHHMTPRHGLRELDLSSPITQNGSRELTQHQELRAEETAAVRNFVDEHKDENPTIIVGDFNMPCESNLYQQNWLGFQNAFNTAGIGYGYSFPCTRQYRWPAGIPWIRLDHILVDSAWQIRSCSVGTANGSDHRLITATLALP